MTAIATIITNPLIAQSAGDQTHSASWALVLFCVILGLLVALGSSRRTTEVKRHKD
jgi:hypothetical protein